MADVDVLFRSSSRRAMWAVSLRDGLKFSRPSARFFVRFCSSTASCLSRCVSREARGGRDVPWWRTLMRYMKKRRKKKRTRTGPRRSSSLSTLRTLWWCEGPATSLCKHLGTLKAIIRGIYLPWNRAGVDNWLLAELAPTVNLVQQAG